MSLPSPSSNPLLSNELYDCNDVWNEQVFYTLGLDQVWCDNGNWIPDEYRYHINENELLDWYSYCENHGINLPFPQVLPTWAIDMMDQYYRELFYGQLTEENKLYLPLSTLPPLLIPITQPIFPTQHTQRMRTYPSVAGREGTIHLNTNQSDAVAIMSNMYSQSNQSNPTLWLSCQICIVKATNYSGIEKTSPATSRLNQFLTPTKNIFSEPSLPFIQ